MKIIIKKLKSSRGQSLLEAVVAVGIIVASVITVIVLGIVTVRAGRASENRLAASNLAREGIEYFRNIRDTNWLRIDNGESITWSEDLDPGDYIIEFNGTDWQKSDPPLSTNINDCSADTTRPCNLKRVVAETAPNKGVYCHTIPFCVSAAGSWEATQFYRLITIQDKTIPVTSGTPGVTTSYLAKNIKSQVRWIEKGQPHDIILEETLTEWR